MFDFSKSFQQQLRHIWRAKKIILNISGLYLRRKKYNSKDKFANYFSSVLIVGVRNDKFIFSKNKLCKFSCPFFVLQLHGHDENAFYGNWLPCSTPCCCCIDFEIRHRGGGCQAHLWSWLGQWSFSEGWRTFPFHWWIISLFPCPSGFVAKETADNARSWFECRYDVSSRPECQ